MSTISRRELLNGVVGLSILTYTVAYAVPIAIEEMFQAASRCLSIEGGVTHTIPAGETEDYTCVEWQDSGAALEFGGEGAALEVRA